MITDIPPLLTTIVTDVSIREGSQQTGQLRGASLEQKLDLFQKIATTGVEIVELTAFAPGEWFADARSLVEKTEMLAPGCKRKAIYFNADGCRQMTEFPALLQYGVFHTAATQNYREKNYRQSSVAAAHEKMKRLTQAFRLYNLSFDELLISTAWGEERVTTSTTELVHFCGELREIAAAEGFEIKCLTLADTVGMAEAAAVEDRFREVRLAWPQVKLKAHLHPARRHAQEVIWAGVEAGVDLWDAAFGGVGGSPFADRPGGNLDIWDLISVWERQGWAHGFNKAAVHEVTQFIKQMSNKADK